LQKSFPFFSLRPDGLQKNNLFLVLPAREPQYPILTISTGIIQKPAQIVNAHGAVFSGSKKQRPGFSDRCHDSVQDSRVP
jgi:hypothetical protein